jgi:hypothetical protein
MMRNVASLAVPGLLVLGALTLSASAEESVSQQHALTLVKSYLYQDFITIDKIEFTAAKFADPKKNAALLLGVNEDPYLSQIETIVRMDYEEYKDEYMVRSHMAQARTSVSGDRSRETYQHNLWEIFISDPRYVSRILTAISAEVPLFNRPPEVPPLTTTLEIVRRVAPALAESLEKRAKQSGCNSKPLTALPVVATEDPMLVTTVFRFYAMNEPSERTLDNAIDILRRNGWVIKE